MNPIDCSLDDIIAAKRKAGRGGRGNRGSKRDGGGGRGGMHVVRKPTITKTKTRSTVTVTRKPVVVKKSQATQSNILSRVSKPASILDRLGTSAAPGKSGTWVTIANLNANIRSGDIAELCGTIGEVKEVEIKSNRSGQSQGVAEVLFARRSDANNAVMKFHGLTLDGTPMKVSLSGDGNKPNPFNPIPVEDPSSNKREGFFGTALEDDDEDTMDDDDDGYVHRGPTTFAVTLGDNGRRSSNRRRDEHDDRGHSSGGRRGPGRGGGRGRGRGNRGRGGGRGRGKERAQISEGDLDDEMDSYMASR
mmetsp:Transcript_13085/g.19730  ORF Transcript_13085/g.19730 Transcript_13085/m.19730 type:complete len:305 (+) Transcript_13085:44-958(+)